MIVKKFDTQEEWLEYRKAKITGSRLKDIITLRGTGRKKGFYELIAERLAVPRQDDLSAMDRGHELEKEAIDRFMAETGKVVSSELVMWQREDNDCIAVSPDGMVEGEDSAVEVKCLNSASHIEAYLTQEVPKDYEFQILQYFIVNEKLQKVYMVFYDPDLSVKQFFFIEITRESVQEDIDKYLDYQMQTLAEVSEIVTRLSF